MPATTESLSLARLLDESPTDVLLDDELVAMREQSVGRLSSGFMHELRNTLTGMRCFMELLTGGDDPAEVEPFREEVDRTIDRMAGLASTFLEISRGQNAIIHLDSELRRLTDLLGSFGNGRDARFDVAATGVDLVALPAARLEAGLLVLFEALLVSRPRDVAVVGAARDDAVELRLEARGDGVEARSIDTHRLSELVGFDVWPLEEPAVGFVVRLPRS